MPRVPSPLKPEHCDCLDRALAQAAAALEMARKCTDCGIDMTAEQQQLEAQAEIAKKLKAQFFPDRI